VSWRRARRLPTLPRLGSDFDALEAALVRSALASTQGNQSAAARLLGLSRAQLIYRLKAMRPSSHG